jgi:hypothetical protein
MDYEERADLSIATTLLAFVETEALPGTGIDPAQFWAGLSSLINTHAGVHSPAKSRAAHRSQIRSGA